MSFRTHQWVEEGVGEVWEGHGLGSTVRWATSLEWHFKAFQFSDATWCTNLQVWMKSQICLVHYSYLQNSWPLSPRQNFLLKLVLLGCSERQWINTLILADGPWIFVVCLAAFPSVLLSATVCQYTASAQWGEWDKTNALVLFVRTNVLQFREISLCNF